MNRLMSPLRIPSLAARSSSLAVLATASLAQGCATSQTTLRAPTPVAQATTAASQPTSRVVSDAAPLMRVAQRTEVAAEKDAPAVAGHPLTSVVVTQCNLIVAVYMTMPDGKLLRFDNSASVSADQLLQMAYTATRSERVEVSCNEAGAVGYEKHDPV
jgi:hypothetical protein